MAQMTRPEFMRRQTSRWGGAPSQRVPTMIVRLVLYEIAHDDCPTF